MFLNEPWEKAWKNSHQSVTILSGQCIERKLNKYTNEAYGSAYERVEVATSSVDVSLGPSTTIPLRQTAEQDGLSNHYLWAQHTKAQHLFSVVPNEEMRSPREKVLHPTSFFRVLCHFCAAALSAASWKYWICSLLLFFRQLCIKWSGTWCIDAWRDDWGLFFPVLILRQF